MIAWWNSLSGLEMIFAYVAIPSTVLLLLQTLMLLFGLGGHDSDASGDHDAECDCGADHEADNGDGIFGDHDHDGDDAAPDHGLRVFTVRGLVAFFTIFGWSGLVLLRGGMNIPASLLISFVLGTISLFIVAVSIKFFLSLSSDGSVNISNAIGKSGVVYLTIPPSRLNTGKVSIILQERLCEYEAVTDIEHELKTGTEVTVVSVSNKNTMVVIPK